MKKLLLILIPVLFFTSCVTQKACDKKFPPTVLEIIKYDSVHDSIYVKEVVRDTVVQVQVGKDTTIYNTDTVTITKGVINSKLVEIEGEFAKASAQVVNGKLKVKLEEFKKLINVNLKGAIVERDTYKNLYKYYYTQSTQLKEKARYNGFTKFCMWWFGITALVGLTVIGFKLKKLLI